MAEPVLLVDDDSGLLGAYRRFLGQAFAVETAAGGAEALEALAARGPFAVVVSDLEMPGMGGIELLAAARERHPDTTRVLLTGKADRDAAIQAVNDGHIFRFLTKPIDPGTLGKAVRAAVEQHRLVTAQRELLDGTLRATVRVLGEVLALVNPAAFGRATRVRQLVRDLAAAAGITVSWEVDVAATLSQVGCIAVPQAVLAKADRGEPLAEAEQRALARHPTVGFELLRSIPRLEPVAELIALQDRRRPASSGVADDDPAAGLLTVALDFDALLRSGAAAGAVLEAMKARAGWYAPAALDALEVVVRRVEPLETREVPVADLVAGMVVAADVPGASGMVLVRAGVRLTEAMLVRLRDMAVYGDIGGTLRVMAPTQGEDGLVARP